MSVAVRAYAAPTLVLLAMDWPKGANRTDFLGFAIRRTPGFRDPATRVQNASDWLPNRLTFSGPVPNGKRDEPSNKAPIQKFLWWDARFGPELEEQVSYEVTPVTGRPGALVLEHGEAASVTVKLPPHVVDGVGTWFNRAVLSSQAFSRKVRALGVPPGQPIPADKALELRKWLGAGLEDVIPEFLSASKSAAAAIYHLTDQQWVIPAWRDFASRGGDAAIVYDSKDDVPLPAAPGTKLGQNQAARLELEPLGLQFYPRNKTAIMHNKFIVAASTRSTPPERLLCGSANFTTGGLTTQANLLHTFESPQLALRYDERANLLHENPTKGATQAANDGWSPYFKVKTAAYVRSIYSPEPKDKRVQIDSIVDAIGRARRSVLFCLFTPTDKKLRQACFEAGNRGLMMFGLSNDVRKPKPLQPGEDPNAAQQAAIELFHRSETNRDVVGGSRFDKQTVPMGFEPELLLFPGTQRGDPRIPIVIIHHKFIVIDGETDDPIVFSGSANMSENSLHNNDENLLEIRSQQVATVYMAEFMRLYEHYRARANFNSFSRAVAAGSDTRRFALRATSDWCTRHYTPGTPESKARLSMSQPQPAWTPSL